MIQGINWSYDDKWTTGRAVSSFMNTFWATLQIYGSISVFVWLGTFDLLEQIGYYIRLKFSYEKSAQQVIENFKELSKFANDNHFSVTFLEIPYLSVAIYNLFQGHPDPYSYVDSDDALCNAITDLNKAIGEINAGNGTHSPMLNCDLERSHKNKGRNKKKFTNFYQ